MGIPPAPRGMPQIEVAFDIDANGIVNVSAKDMATGKEQAMTITGGTALSKDDINRMVEDAEKFAAEDHKRREAAEARNQADQLAYQVDKFVTEKGDKVPEPTRPSSHGERRAQGGAEGRGRRGGEAHGRDRRHDAGLPARRPGDVPEQAGQASGGAEAGADAGDDGRRPSRSRGRRRRRRDRRRRGGVVKWPPGRGRRRAADPHHGQAAVQRRRTPTHGRPCPPGRRGGGRRTHLRARSREAAEYLDHLRRLQAEFDNYRKRVLREQTDRVERAPRRVPRMLEVLDDFELALMAANGKPDFDRFLQGVELVYAKLAETLKAEGLERIEAEGKPFDPEQHEALMQTGDGEATRSWPTCCARVYARGRVLRPAGVRVERE